MAGPRPHLGKSVQSHAGFRVCHANILGRTSVLTASAAVCAGDEDAGCCSLLSCTNPADINRIVLISIAQNTLELSMPASKRPVIGIRKGPIKNLTWRCSAAISLSRWSWLRCLYPAAALRATPCAGGGSPVAGTPGSSSSMVRLPPLSRVCAFAARCTSDEKNLQNTDDGL